MRFKKWLEARDFNYLSVGHNWDGHFDTWVLKRRRDNILYASELGKNPEHFHDDYQNGVDFKGRIDHDKKQISIVAEWGDEERLKYVASLLKTKYPNYEVWAFSYGRPKQI